MSKDAHFENLVPGGQRNDIVPASDTEKKQLPAAQMKDDVRIQKKGIVKQAIDGFKNRDYKSLGDTIFETGKTAAKDFSYQALMNLVRTIIYGDDTPGLGGYYGGYYGGGSIPYQTFYKYGGKVTQAAKSMLKGSETVLPEEKGTLSYDEIVFSGQDAAAIKAEILSYISEYPAISIGDIYGIIKQTLESNPDKPGTRRVLMLMKESTFTDNGYGWYDVDLAMREAKLLRPVKNGYILDLPKPRYIK